MPELAPIQTRMARTPKAFGKIHVPPAHAWPSNVATGAIQFRPTRPEHRADPRAFIAWLIAEQHFTRGADDLELRLEDGKVTLATVTFIAE